VIVVAAIAKVMVEDELLTLTFHVAMAVEPLDTFVNTGASNAAPADNVADGGARPVPVA